MRRIAKYTGYAFLAILLLIGGFIVLVNTAPDFVLSGISKSHTDANSPDQSDFDTFLTRDLKSYFSQKLGKDVDVKYEMFRNGPTQSGTAYPKYYLWVTVSSANKSALLGAVRVAAMNKESFSVTDFVSVADVRSNPSVLSQIFPTALIQNIRSRAESDSELP
jgi:hypothetical protein